MYGAVGVPSMEGSGSGVRGLMTVEVRVAVGGVRVFSLHLGVRKQSY